MYSNAKLKGHNSPLKTTSKRQQTYKSFYMRNCSMPKCHGNFWIKCIKLLFFFPQRSLSVLSFWALSPWKAKKTPRRRIFFLCCSMLCHFLVLRLQNTSENRIDSHKGLRGLSSHSGWIAECTWASVCIADWRKQFWSRITTIESSKLGPRIALFVFREQRKEIHCFGQFRLFVFVAIAQLFECYRGNECPFSHQKRDLH